MNAKVAAAFAPRAVTIVGASERSTHTRYLLDNLRRPSCTFPGSINLVNRSCAVIDGIASVASTADLRSEPGLVLLLVPPDQCLSALEGFREAPQGVVVFGGGAEAGHAETEVALTRWARSHDVPLIGPQSTGIASFHGGLMSVIAPLRAEPVLGSIALIMQSAGLLGGTLNSCFQRELGLHSAASIGNATVLGFEELGLHFLGEPGVRALGMYLDAVQSSEGLRKVAQAGLSLAKPIVLVVGGSSEAGSLAVLSHTGALATSRRIVEGIAAQYGIVLAANTDELVWSLEAIAATGYTRPRRGGIQLVASSGGAGIVMADALSAAGVPLALPAPSTQAALRERRPVMTFNPFDAGAASLDHPEDLRWLVSTLASDPAYSVVVSVAAAGLPARDGMAAHLRQSTTFIEAVRSTGRLPFLAAPVVAGLGPSTRPPASWPGTPVAGGVTEAASKLRALWLWANGPDGGQVDSGPTEPPAVAHGEPTITSGPAARRRLAALALTWPGEVLVGPADDPHAALREIGFPLVAKAEAGLAHRAASGGVLRGLGSQRVALAAIEYLRARFDAGVALAEDIPHDREYVLGFQRDGRYGPLLMFGLGGTNVGGAVEFRLLPLGASEADRLVAPYATDADERRALVDAVRSLGPLALADPTIVSIDLNPIVVRGGRVVALDAKIHVLGGSAPPPPR